MPSGVTDSSPRTQPSQGSLGPTQAAVQSGVRSGSGRTDDGGSLTGPSNTDNSSSSSSEVTGDGHEQGSVIDATAPENQALQQLDIDESGSESPIVSMLLRPEGQ
eukprot:14966102-Alexandrium_andersonii.AAC.1